MSCHMLLVPRLRLGTHCKHGSAVRVLRLIPSPAIARQSLAGIAFPGGAWERGRRWGFRAALAATYSMICIVSIKADDAPAQFPRRYCENGFERAGNPQEIACRPHASDTSAYCGYTVGGGAAHHGEPRYLDEGTWGWDYTGWLFQRRVGLDWFHGARYQGGPGAYKTDGPRLLH